MKYDEEEWSVLQGGNGKMLVTSEIMGDIWDPSFNRMIRPELKK